MRVSKRFTPTLARIVLLLLACSVVFTSVTVLAVPNYETHAYYSVVRDNPYAPYTAPNYETHAYYSVVRDDPYAPYTETEVPHPPTSIYRGLLK